LNVASYRKKPVTIQATRWDGSQDEAREIVEWINGLSGDAHVRDRGWMEEQGIDVAQFIGVENLTHSISIATLEGDMFVLPGDWVIRGLAGEFYPCKNEIFEQSYTSVGRA
jgi:hypothetical protein